VTEISYINAARRFYVGLIYLLARPFYRDRLLAMTIEV
jgi:hypothetical protein